jgi:hypothetical protein
MRGLRAVVAAGCAVALVSGCESVRRIAWQSGLPGVAAYFHVDSLKRRAGYLDARLSTGSLERRIFARADDPVCEAMLQEGQKVRWARSEPFGPLSQDDARCAVVGLGDLERWRDARGRISTTSNPITTSQTSLVLVHRDETHLYVLGGFGLAGLLAWSPGTDQVLAMVPRGETCAELEREDRARGRRFTIQFRIRGRPALALVTPQGLCPVEAVMAAPRPEPGGDTAE